MKPSSPSYRWFRAAFSLVAASFLISLSASAAVPAHRLAQSFDSSVRTELPNTVTARAQHATQLGTLDGSTQLSTMTMVLQPTAAQQADLNQLLADQQNPASAHYHQWLTPTEYGARFGVSDADLKVLTSWLTSQGLQIVSIPASRNAINFTGAASQVENAFSVSMKRYRSNGETYFENDGNIQLPSALSSIVSGVTGLSNFRAKHFTRTVAKPTYTTTAGAHYLTPYDFRQIYGVNTLVNAGYTGSGVTIGVIGQTYISTAQIAYFRTLTGQSGAAAPTLVCTGSSCSTVDTDYEGEAEVDIEYAGGVAPGATIKYIYNADSTSNGVFDALIYAVQNKSAQILTMSYGSCEPDMATYAQGTFEPILQQANAQGQTILVSSGDWNAATCDEIRLGDFSTATQGATVSYPASSPYVTGVGGTMFSGDSTGSSSYWSSSNNSSNGSALTYIPEAAWNETSSNCSTSGGVTTCDALGTGGGKSSLFSKPSWQTGTGVPSDGKRDVPDVAFNSAVYHDAYLYCSAASSSYSCTSTSFGGYVIGGTSLASPSAAGLLAVVESAHSGTSLGNINSVLYSLASSNYAAVFNDVTSGNNQVTCATGTADCTSGTLGYTAGTGYDQTTGWGSINASGLSTYLPSSTSTGKTTPQINLTQSSVYVVASTAATYTAAVTGNTTVPTGTVSFYLDGSSTATSTVPVTAGTYSATAALSSTFTSTGSHTVTATYSGDSNYNSVSTTLTVTVYSALTGSFTMSSSPTTLSITSGNSGAETLTLTPSSGFLDTINFSASASGSGTLSACYTLLSTPITSTSAATATMTIYTSSSSCSSSSAIAIPLVHVNKSQNAPLSTSLRPLQGIAIAGILIGLMGARRSKVLRGLLVLCLVAGTMSLTGCGSSGGNSSSSSSSSSSSGSFTITVTGTGVRSGATATTTFTLKIS